MNGTQYHLKKFSNPASHNTSQIQWDYSFLTKKKFIEKYGEAAWKTLSKVST